MSEDWKLLTTAPNLPAAHVTENLLGSVGIECRLAADTVILGEGRSCGIYVEASQLQRAQQALGETVFTDAELDFLATGQVSCEDAKEKL